MPIGAQIILTIVALTWSIAVLLSVATALLARRARQREDAHNILRELLRFRPPPG